MADANVLTAEVSVCFDPLLNPAPRGKTIWVVGPGGSGFKGHWFPEAIAWAYLPQVPESVKARQDQLQKEKQQREQDHGHTYYHPGVPEEQKR